MTKKYSLIGIDGNAFSIIGYTKKCLDKTSADEYKSKVSLCKSYDELLDISQEYIDIANGE